MGNASSNATKDTDRRSQAMQYRRLGLTYREIGERMGVSAVAAHKLVKKEIAEIQAQLTEDTKEVITVECERLDILLKAAMKKVSSGEVSGINAVLSIMDRRARLLGLDKPQKTAETTAEGLDLTPEQRAVRIKELKNKLGKK